MTTQFERSLKKNSSPQGEETTSAGWRQQGELPKPSRRPHVASSQQKTPLVQWFSKLPVRQKLLAGLFASGVVSIGGLTVVGTGILVLHELDQLEKHAKTELQVTKINYQIKVDQMAFDFHGKADNNIIIEAARNHAEGQPLSLKTQEQLKRLLRYEIIDHNIEYFTLVGKDLRIIANANGNRAGEVFDPNGLVSTLLKNPSQIKTNAIASWQDLQKEAPPLPEGLSARDALIRYTLTPVRDPNTDAVIGVLVSGDIVNGKRPIVQNTLQILNGGYSAIYQWQSPGKFVLATSLNQEQGKAESATANLELADLSILERAAANLGNPITDRIKVGTQTYTVAAEALADFNGQPTAVLVRGTPENELYSILRKDLILEGLVIAIVALFNFFLARMLGRSIADPLKHLQRMAEKFAATDRLARANITATDEIGQLAASFNHMADSIVAGEAQLAAAADRSQLLNQIVLSVRRSLNEEEILNTAIGELRDALNTDRVIVYRFHDDWNGTIVAESVGGDWRQILGETVNDPFREGLIENYRNGRVRAMNDIYAEGLADCHRHILESFQIRASIVAPLVHNEYLIGLLCVHHCFGPRSWEEAEIELVAKLAIQLGFALEQASLLQQQKMAKEAIQKQLIDLLGDIEGAAQGDLTVRAEVTAGDIGTVADFFNSIVESLRQIVTKVKQSALLVNASLGENEDGIRQLAQLALKQTEETTRTLESVEQMTTSIQAVAWSASQAAEVARTASVTAESGEMAMDLTVQNILILRETVAETAKKVKRLGESSQQISKVVSLINQIAMQTNLLAINAGIEAARAGEEGHGFAVVAEEVGALANRSANATQEIERIVEGIQRETAQVVEAMEQSTAQVVEGTKLVEGTKQSLGQILEVSRQIDQLVQSIFTATASQVQTAEAVSSLMQDIAQVSEQTANSSRQMSHSLRQTVEIAQELQTSVGSFKVGS
jgi:twitching motility protein PilJ